MAGSGGRICDMRASGRHRGQEGGILGQLPVKLWDILAIVLLSL